ncbi:MAG: hypothetical protein KTR26_14300 [Flammeovirgaceae bacterium]|nr:hypothetical protein [Flammeovirgaceae bacterium]
MPEGEIYDSRDDGSDETSFGYLMIAGTPPRIKPVFKVFLQTSLTRGKKAGTRVKYEVVIIPEVNTSEGMLELPIAVVTEILEEPA